MVTISSTVEEPATLPVIKYIPVSTAHQARLQMFQPTRRPVYCQREIKTAWGDATVRGKVGQAHADALETLLQIAEDNRVDETGRLMLLVDPYLLRKSIGGESVVNIEQTWSLLEDMRQVVISLRATDTRGRAIGGILDMVEESAFAKESRNKSQRKLWRVTFNPIFTKFLTTDIPLFYSPSKVSKLRYGVSQAVARLALSHVAAPNGGWKMDELINAVGAGGASIRKRRSEIRDDSAGLAVCGIMVDGDRVNKA